MIKLYSGDELIPEDTPVITIGFRNMSILKRMGNDIYNLDVVNKIWFPCCKLKDLYIYKWAKIEIE